nr:hypothetical protein [Tanacetum cinerariifolium]
MRFVPFLILVKYDGLILLFVHRLWRNRTRSFRDLHGGKSIHIALEKRDIMIGKVQWVTTEGGWEGGSLWDRMIKSIHGISGGIREGGLGLWGGGGLEGHCEDWQKDRWGGGRVHFLLWVVLGDGRDIIFWVDRWVDDRRLCDRFSRLYHLDKRKESSVWEKGSWDNMVWCWDKWRWSLGEDGNFAV